MPRKHTKKSTAKRSWHFYVGSFCAIGAIVMLFNNLAASLLYAVVAFILLRKNKANAPRKDNNITATGQEQTNTSAALTDSHVVNSTPPTPVPNVPKQEPVNDIANLITRSITQKTKPIAHTLPIYNFDFIQECKKCFIAFDVETTGIDPSIDRIVEISAVRFENFKAVDTFSTLINPQMHIPAAASKVNHIYDEDVADAPREQAAIDKFCDFIGKEVLDGNITLVAHNAMFDIKFLLHALSFCGIDADISFQDTLSMCRDAGLGLENNKLGTIAQHFGIEQRDAHRAEDDARVCGEIFIQLIAKRESILNAKLSELNDEEIYLCKWLKEVFNEADLDTQFLCFHTGTYFVCRCVYDVLKFKTRTRIPYVLVRRDTPIPEELETAATSKAEGDKYVRVLYKKVHELESLKPYFIDAYKSAFEMAEQYIYASERNMREAAKNASSQISI